MDIILAVLFMVSLFAVVLVAMTSDRREYRRTVLNDEIKFWTSFVGLASSGISLFFMAGWFLFGIKQVNLSFGILVDFAVLAICGWQVFKNDISGLLEKLLETFRSARRRLLTKPVRQIRRAWFRTRVGKCALCAKLNLAVVFRKH